MTSPAASGGLFASLRRLTGSALALVHLRLELLALDLEQEKQHLLSFLFWAAVAFMLLGIGLVLAVILVLHLFWDSHRLAALITLTLIFLGSALWVALSARARLRSTQGWFGNTRSELARDLTALGDRQ